MKAYQIKIGNEYKLTYPKKEGVICKVLSIDEDGDCKIVFNNGKKDLYHCDWLEEIKD